ncbi:MAG: RHS repeat protein [Sedimentisphaerales bacterium]|nr:RHS repeat protein [Sedimentisphaerales bacterium]
MSTNTRRSRHLLRTSCCTTLASALILASLARADDPNSASGVSVNQTTCATMGDPISANSGAYHFSLPLMNLGGPMPLRFGLSYRMDQYSSPGMLSRFQSNLHLQLERMEHRTTKQPVVEVTLCNGVTPQFTYDADSNEWNLDPASPVRYVLKETGADYNHGYYYLMDPVREIVYVFEKVPTMWGPSWAPGRVAYITDRNGNRHTYAYTGDNLVPDRVEDGLGRRLDLTYYSGSDTLQRVIDQAGRSVQLRRQLDAPGLEGWELLGSVTDAAQNTTTFHYTNVSGAKIVAVDRPLGNTPYTQSVAQIKLNGVTKARVTAQTDAYGNVTSYAYDSAINRVTETRPDATTVIYEHYHNNGVPKSITDPAGNVIAFAQTTNEQVSQITDRLGNTIEIAYHLPTGKVTQYTDAEGNATVFTYEAQQQTFTNPATNESVAFTFYNLVEVGYADGSRERFTHDGEGNVLTRTDQNNQKWSFTYNEQGQPLTTTNPSGGVVACTYNPDATPASRTDSETGVTRYDYDELKRLRQITRPDGQTVRLTYDRNDRLLSYTNEQGKTWELVYDQNGNLVSSTDRMRQTATQAYDLMDQLTSQTDPLGHAAHYSYGALGRLKTATDRNGNTTTYSYDPRGWLTGMTDPAGNLWIVTYDDEGVPKATTTPTGISTTFQTDRLSRTTGMTDALGATARLAYDERGRLTSTIDRLGRVTTYAYDAADRLTSVGKPLLGTATYTRSALGRLTRIDDLRGKSWDFSYSPMGRLTSDTDPLSRQRTYAYDNQGRLRQITYPGGDTTTLIRDSVGRVTRAACPSGLTLEFTYDDAGRLLTANDLRLSRDARGDIINGQEGTASFGATYDNGRRLASVTYDDQATVTYTYDARNLLTRVSDSLCGAWMEFRYDADGRLVEARRSNTVNTTYSYDPAGRLLRVQDGTLANQQYSLDAEGEPLQAVMNLPSGAETIAYTYDDADRLTGADYGSGNRLSYTYDPAGNLTNTTGKTPLEPVVRSDSFTYDDASQISSPGYSCDNRGRLSAAPGRTFAYDGAGRLISIAAGQSTATFTYNGLGDLRTRTAAGVTTIYHHNYALASSPIVADKEGTSYKRFYVYAPDGRLLYSVDPAGRAVRFYHFDRTGSTLFLSDDGGAVSDSYAYDPYGNLLAHSGPSDQPFTFVGQYGVRWEPVGTLCHMGARYYDPAAARFLSRDPAWPVPADPHSLNPYQYVAQNPLHYIDHSGTDGWDPTVPHVQTGANTYVTPGQQTSSQPCPYASQSTFTPPTSQSIMDGIVQDAMNQASISSASVDAGPTTATIVAVSGPWGGGEASAIGTVGADTPVGQGDLTTSVDITTTGGMIIQSAQIGDTGVATGVANNRTTVAGGAIVTGPGQSSAWTIVAVNPTVAGAYIQTQVNLPSETGAGAFVVVRPVTHGDLQIGGNVVIAGQEFGLSFGFEGFVPTASVTLPFVGNIFGGGGSRPSNQE